MKSGSRARPVTRRRSPMACAAIAPSSASTSAGIEGSAQQRAQQHAAFGRAAGKHRCLVLAAEQLDAFAAGDDEAVRVEIHAEADRAGRSGFARPSPSREVRNPLRVRRGVSKTDADHGHGRVRDRAQRRGRRGRVRGEQRRGRRRRRRQHQPVALDEGALGRGHAPAAGHRSDLGGARPAPARAQRLRERRRQLAEAAGE